jgi:cytidylate kinase
VAPLVKPEGAVEVDTSGNTIEQTQAELLRHLESIR